MPRPKRVTGGRSAKNYAILVVYDGEKTEDSYFRGWQQILSASRLTLKPMFVRSGGNPLKAVKECNRLTKKLRDGFAEIWCVSDVDNSTDEIVDQARAYSKKFGIRLILSNRCFEIWIALHKEYSEKEITSEKEAVAMVRKHFPDFANPVKSVPFLELLPLTNEAIANSNRLGSKDLANPSTEVAPLAKKLQENLPKS